MSKTENCTVESPCIQVCKLDESNICIGCFRSLDEIAKWGTLTVQKKRDVLSISEARRHSANEAVER